MTSRFLLLAACAITLTACEQKTAEAPPADPAAPGPVAAEPVAPAGKVIPLTSEGFGPLTIGMKEEEAAVAIGGFKDGTPSAECHERAAADPGLGIIVMFEEGLVSRISLAKDSKVQTDHALSLGDTEAKVRQAYATGLKEEPHKYLPAPSKRLTYWDKAPVRGVTYEIHQNGNVGAIYAGGPSIQYVEGCS